MTDYQTVSRGLDDLIRDSVKLVYVEHSFDLGEDSGQEAKVAASHSNQLCDDLWWELLIREFNAYRGPALLQVPGMPIRTIPALPSSKMDRRVDRWPITWRGLRSGRAV